MADAQNLLEAGETVASLLLRHGVASVVIGAVALAAHRHMRCTEDIDPGVNADLPTLCASLQKLWKRKDFELDARSFLRAHHPANIL